MCCINTYTEPTAGQTDVPNQDHYEVFRNQFQLITCDYNCSFVFHLLNKIYEILRYFDQSKLRIWWEQSYGPMLPCYDIDFS